MPVVTEWGFWVKFISTPIIVFVGIIGNCLSFIVMKTKTLRHKSYSHYLCALAVFDTLSLITRQLDSVDEYFVSHEAKPGVFQNFNNISCKLYNFSSRVVTLMSSWLVVFMAIERLIAVCFPFKNTALRKQTGAMCAIGVLLLFVLVSQSFRVLMIEHIKYDPEYNIWDCLAAYDYIEIYTSLDVYFFQWSLLFVLPVIVIVVCNSMVLYRISKVKRELYKDEKYLTNRHKQVLGKKHRSTCMLLTVTLTYIITLMPLFMLSLIVDLSIKFGDLETARYIFFTLKPYIDMCVSVSLINYAVNFFIYVLSGKRFRYELSRSLWRTNRMKRTNVYYKKYTRGMIEALDATGNRTTTNS